ncbi:MAG: DUF1249 domain-containing protein [Gammaproteobacteria bacterium]
MLVTNKQSGFVRKKARDLPRLMELYELNYLLLRRLMPEEQSLPDHVISRVQNALDLHLRLVERSPYTTTFRLTYIFHDDQGEFPAPELLCRTYHDARLAEVISRGRRRGKRSAEYDRFRHSYSIEKKWEVNRFLYKWLSYSLRQQHGFAPGHRQLAEAEIAVTNDSLTGKTKPK